MYAWHPNRTNNVYASAASAELFSETYVPAHTTRTILAIQTIRGPDGRTICIKGSKTYEFVTRIISKYIQFTYTRKYA